MSFFDNVMEVSVSCSRKGNTDYSHMDKVCLTHMLETPLNPFVILYSFQSFCLFRSLLASSTSTTLHQFGLSTRRPLRCFWTRCACLQHRRLRPTRYSATTSCRSRLHSSFCLRPLCSLGEPWRVRPPRKCGVEVERAFQAPSTEPCHVGSLEFS